MGAAAVSVQGVWLTAEAIAAEACATAEIVVLPPTCIRMVGVQGSESICLGYAVFCFAPFFPFCSQRKSTQH